MQLTLSAKPFNICLLRSAIICLLLWLSPSLAQQDSSQDTAQSSADELNQTLETLKLFIELSNTQSNDINQQQQKLKAETSASEQAVLAQQLEQLRDKKRSTEKNFKEISAGTDISILQTNEEKAFNLQEELLAILKPVFDEVREITAPVRQKASLKEKILYYNERLPVVESVIDNIKRLLEINKDKQLKKALNTSLDEWQKQQAFMQSELQAAQVQLEKLLTAESSIAESSQAYFKKFFKKRGLYLIQALTLVLFIMFISRYSFSAMKRLLPGFQAKHRSFKVRLLELAHRSISLLLIVLGPMLVFYLVEDWVLFSLGLLLLFGLSWTLVRALPLIWRQVHLFLNIGSVREGERIDYDGLPWLVERINLYCILTNPMAKISLRIPIAEMVELKSRPFLSTEPWFPCMLGDWVILSDGVRGKVTGISPELVRLVKRGGAQVTYPTSTFLSNNPQNLATNFRIKELFGISYTHQAQSTTVIPETLQAFILQKASEEGYGDQLLRLRVELAQASSSSLDVVIVADFKGELGDLYNRLRRAIQRWCVNACTENGWEIPFPQLTVHGTVNTPNA